MGRLRAGLRHAVFCCCILAVPLHSGAAQLSTVQSVNQLWEQTALNAAEATLLAIQRETGQDMSLRGVPLDSLKVRCGAARSSVSCVGASAVVHHMLNMVAFTGSTSALLGQSVHRVLLHPMSKGASNPVCSCKQHS